MRTQYNYSNKKEPQGLSCSRCKRDDFSSPRHLVNHLFADHMVSSKDAWSEATKIFNESRITTPPQEVGSREPVDLDRASGMYVVKKDSEKIPHKPSLRDQNNLPLPSPEEVKRQVQEMETVPVIAKTKPKYWRKPIDSVDEIVKVTEDEVFKEVQEVIIKPPIEKRVVKHSNTFIIKHLDKNIRRLEQDLQGQKIIRDIVKELKDYIP